MQILQIPEVQALIATLIAYVWLTHVQAVLPPQVRDALPGLARRILEAMAGNYGNAKNTQAPMGPASPLAALALTAIAAVCAALPVVASRPVPAAVVTVPAAAGLALPEAATATGLATDASAVAP